MNFLPSPTAIAAAPLRAGRARPAASLLPAGLFLLVAARLLVGASMATPLLETTAVLAQPDPSAPAITYLKAGSEPVPAADALASTPAGWMAVNLSGPFEGYVLNRDLTKGLDVKPGSPIYLAPKPEAGVLATASKGDKIEITGLRGKWTQIRLEKTLVAYIHLGPMGPVAAAPAAESAANPDQSTSPGTPPAAPVDVAAPPPPPAAGHAAATSSDDGNGALPRFFEGRFVTSRRMFAPHRPYNWEIDDASGTRIAYLDLSKLLLTEQIASYANRYVEVYGGVSPVPSTRDLVIVVESLQLK